MKGKHAGKMKCKTYRDQETRRTEKLVSLLKELCVKLYHEFLTSCLGHEYGGTCYITFCTQDKVNVLEVYLPTADKSGKPANLYVRIVC